LEFLSTDPQLRLSGIDPNRGRLSSALNYRPLLVNRKLGVTNNVDEKDMRDFEPNLLFNLGGHAMNLPVPADESRPKVALSDIIRSAQ
jgi:hypothetical protein